MIVVLYIFGGALLSCTLYLSYNKYLWNPPVKSFNTKIDFILSKIKIERDEEVKTEKTEPLKQFAKIWSQGSGDEPYLIDELKRELKEKFSETSAEVDSIFDKAMQDGIIQIVSEKGLLMSQETKDIISTYGSYTNYYEKIERENRYPAAFSGATAILNLAAAIGIVLLTAWIADEANENKKLIQRVHSLESIIINKNKSLNYRQKTIEYKDSLIYIIRSKRY